MKNIICLGDSNTFGYSGDPNEKKGRFNTSQRWTSLLQKELGSTFSIKEEGMNGRTIQFPEQNQANSCGIDVISSILKQHSPISLLIIMLGSNDTQERFDASPEMITEGLKKLIQLSQEQDVWENNQKNILVISPPAMQTGFHNGPFAGLMGSNAVEKSIALADHFKSLSEREQCYFFDANIDVITENGINQVDFLHLNLLGHQALAKNLLPLILNIPF